ncbi:MAG: hypothetical protein HYT61_03390 [Candidatus Yanofskybacteria bacterium]|nr:hypothetical protein [Candidatus Yanofskybacteria bacterium]
MSKHINNEVVVEEEMNNEGLGTDLAVQTPPKRKKHLIPILVFLALTTSGLAFYFYNEAAVLKEDPNKIVREETAKLVAQISKLIILPEGETPTVATVSDPEKLKDQQFFVKAKKGDKLLLYANAKKAILYDPDNNKIVEVAPISIGNK